MYITRVKPLRPQSWGYQRHLAIESLFPGASKNESGHLFRWDGYTTIQSVMVPEFSDIAAAHIQPDIKTKELNLIDVCKRFEYLRFSSIVDCPKKDAKTKRHYPRPIADIPAWVDRAFDGVAAIEPDSLMIVRKDRLRVSKSQRQWSINPVEITGILKTIDPVRLAVALTLGIGRSKAFGCGLVQIARV